MPELPEVEVTMRAIRPYVEGQKISEIVVRERKFRKPVPEDLERRMTGRKVEKLERRSKYLVFRVKDGMMVIHLGMSGHISVIKKGENKELIKHDHVDVKMSNGAILRLNDPRRFGLVDFWAGDEAEYPPFTVLGVEPFSEDFTPQMLHAALKGRKTKIKEALMSGKIVVGAGNIYANEALFMSGVHPERLSCDVTQEEATKIHDNLLVVLAKSIETGGSSLRDFVHVDGKPGYFQLSCKVYGKEGEKCPVCGDIVKCVKIGGRSSFFCPTCQK